MSTAAQSVVGSLRPNIGEVISPGSAPPPNANIHGGASVASPAPVVPVATVPSSVSQAALTPLEPTPVPTPPIFTPEPTLPPAKPPRRKLWGKRKNDNLTSVVDGGYTAESMEGVPRHHSFTWVWTALGLIAAAVVVVAIWQYLDSRQVKTDIDALRTGQTTLLTKAQAEALSERIGRIESQLDLLQDTEEVTTIQGPQGETGAIGPAGQAGAPGARGPQGEPGQNGQDGQDGASGVATCVYGVCLSLQQDTPTQQEMGSINISGEIAAGSLAVSGAGNIGGTLTVADGALFNGTLSVASGATFGANVAVAGTISASKFSISCPAGYVVVPGNSKFGTSDFCLMKYQAKNVGGVATAVATGAPWANISQRTSQDMSRAAGGHLVTEMEWMTVATDILWQPENWCNLNGSGCGFAPGTSGKYLASGHNDNSPAQALEASSDDSQACFGTVTAGVDTVCGSVSGTQKRTHTLSNGEVIWDLAGNITEWTDAWITGNEQPTTADSYIDTTDHFQWRQWNTVNKRIGYLQYAMPTNRGWGQNQRIGDLYSLDDSGYSSTNYTQYGFRRGGNWNNGSNAGVFALYLNGTPTITGEDVGFRVAR